MFNLGMGEITVILLLALIFLGPSKLPELAAGLGKIIKDIRKATSDVKNEIALDDTFRKPFEELRDAVTLHPDELKRRDRIKADLEDIRRRAEEDAARAAAEAPTAPVDEAAGVITPPPVLTAPPPIAAAAPPTPAAPAPVAAAPPLTPARAATPPLGTVARKDTLRRAPLAGSTAAAPGTPAGLRRTPGPFPSEPPPRPPVAGPPRVVPPTSSASGDRANTTQFLTEEDLMPGGPAQPPAPPPVPGSGSGKVPLPGTKAPAPPGDKKS